MSATASQIITDAFRESNLIPVGSTPTSNENTEGLRRLNALINSLISTACGELIFDWQIPPVATAPLYGQVANPRDPYGQTAVTTTYPFPAINTRLLTQLTQSATVYLPQYPNDGSRVAIADTGSGSGLTLTLDANGRKVENAATVDLDPLTVGQREWFYRADLANWVRRADLAIGDEQPFPAKYDDFLVTALAIRLSPRYAAEIAEATAMTYKSTLAAFKAQYKQPTVTPDTYDIRSIQTRPRGYGSLGQFIAGSS